MKNQSKLGELFDRVHSTQYDHDDTLALAGVVAQLIEEMQRIESLARHANNTASCLANGIRPD